MRPLPKANIGCCVICTLVVDVTDAVEVWEIPASDA